MSKHSPASKPIDDIQDRMGSMEPLDFDKDDEPQRRIGDELPEGEQARRFPPQRVREAGMTGGSMPDHQPTDDDLSPETLIDEDGARSPREAGDDGGPLDRRVRLVGAAEAGTGRGLDEAELGRVDPLDGKPWASASDDQLDEDGLLEQDDSVLDDKELAGDALLDTGRDRTTIPPEKN